VQCTVSNFLRSPQPGRHGGRNWSAWSCTRERRRATARCSPGRRNTQNTHFTNINTQILYYTFLPLPQHREHCGAPGGAAGLHPPGIIAEVVFGIFKETLSL
jgi:hypothetical protein